MNNRIITPHVLSIEETVAKVQTDVKEGLQSEEAQRRLREFGENKIESKKQVSALRILFANVNNIIVYLLIAASIVTYILGDMVESIAVLVAIFIAVFSGFISEYKAQKSIESLKNMANTVTKVKRDSTISEIDARFLVRGDLIFIEEGDSITTDARIVESKNFGAIESALTGESEAVEKDHRFIGDELTPIGDRQNMVFTGTAATRGNAYAVVVGTGMNTELGKISSMLNEEQQSDTPLEEQLDKLGKTLMLFSAFVALAVTLLGIITGEEIYLIIKIGIILAIAAVPEALPAVSTITLAIGMRNMANHNALVKSLPAVETLGSTTVICTDKTGTLTENQMTVREVYLASGKIYQVAGNGYNPTGELKDEESDADSNADDELRSLVIAGVLSSNASVVQEGDEYKVIGDPTEGGIVVLGMKAGIDKSELEQEGYSRIGEVPFSSKEKYMATAYEIKDGDTRIFIKGAPDVLIAMSDHKDQRAEELLRQNEAYAAKGMRVLAIGEIRNYSGDGSETSIAEALEKGIEFLGLTGIIDPPREDVGQAITEAQDAGIRIIMITGDHPKTAQIIAKSIHMENTDKVITGTEMDQMSDDELAQEILTTSIFARVSPENKLQIVRALNIDKEVTAMTGDGVNDAPALQGADIGIAMGIRGTEVAKEASDMILTDDRFSTIVDAVRQGRIIFDNIEKFVYFLFSCNVVEILAVFLSILLRLPMPILALQILWLNLVVDVLPAMSLAWEPGEADIMKKKPRDPEQAIVSRAFLFRILGNGALIGLGSLAVFVYGLYAQYSLEIARTMSFSAMAYGQLFHIFNVREKNAFGIDRTIFKNPYLIGAVISSIVLQLVAVHVPFFNAVLGTVPLQGYQWGIVSLGAIIPTALIQFTRIIRVGTQRTASAGERE